MVPDEVTDVSHIQHTPGKNITILSQDILYPHMFPSIILVMYHAPLIILTAKSERMRHK